MSSISKDEAVEIEELGVTFVSIVPVHLFTLWDILFGPYIDTAFKLWLIFSNILYHDIWVFIVIEKISEWEAISAEVFVIELSAFGREPHLLIES